MGNENVIVISVVGWAAIPSITKMKLISGPINGDPISVISDPIK